MGKGQWFSTQWHFGSGLTKYVFRREKVTKIAPTKVTHDLMLMAMPPTGLTPRLWNTSLTTVNASISQSSLSSRTFSHSPSIPPQQYHLWPLCHDHLPAVSLPYPPGPQKQGFEPSPPIPIHQLHKPGSLPCHMLFPNLHTTPVICLLQFLYLPMTPHLHHNATT